jgi:hypothetical protein
MKDKQKNLSFWLALIGFLISWSAVLFSIYGGVYYSIWLSVSACSFTSFLFGQQCQ